MKKVLLLLSILFIAVITTACINNLAIQELNNKAKSFMDDGDYQSAIERLKSSIDLDPTIFETQYNLAVAYTKADDYSNAIKAYNDAIKLKPDFPDTYYSLAVCEENLSVDIYNKVLTIDDDGNIVKYEPDEDEETTSDSKYSGKELNYMSELLQSAVKHYQTYLEKNTAAAADSDDVKAKIEELNKRIEDLNNAEVQ